MLAGDGLHPSAKGVRVAFEGSERRVIDGPFAETRHSRDTTPDRASLCQRGARSSTGNRRASA
jgi:hypothetical protein